MYRIPLLLGLFMTIFSAHAQFLTEYAADGHNVRFTAMAKRNGNYMVAGTEGKHIVVAEIRPDGILVRSTNLSVVATDVEQPVKSMIVDSEGFLVLAGYREPVDVLASEAFILKYNWDADSVLWCKVYDQPGCNFFKVIEKNPGGNYIVCGMQRLIITELHNLLIEVDRTTGSFDFLDVSSHDPFSDTYYSIDNNNTNIFATSRQQFYGGSADKMRPVVTKYTNTGDVVYNNSYLRDTTDYARLYGTDILVQKKKLVMLACGGGGTTSTARDLYAVCTSLTGSIKWSKYYDVTTTTLDGTWLSIKPYGNNYLIAGSMYNPNDPLGYGHGGKIFVIYTTYEGEIIWANQYEIYSDYYYFLGHTDMLIVDGDKFLLCGSLKNPVTNKYHGVVMKAPVSDGVMVDGCSSPLSVLAYNEPPVRQPASLQHPADIFGITDISVPVETAADYLYDAYCIPPEFAGEIDARMGKQDYLSLAAYSPASEELIYSLNIQESADAYVEIYGIQGSRVYAAPVSVNPINSIDVTALPPGTYILHVQLAGVSQNLTSTFIKN